MKKKLVITFLIALNVQVFSQFGFQKIQLHNGNVLRGKVLTDSTGYVRLKTVDGNIFRFSTDEISRMEAMKMPVIDFISAGFLMGTAKNEEAAFLSVINELNYCPNSFFSGGFVTGIELLNETTIPFGFNLKSYLPLSSRVLFLNFSIGKSFSLDKPFLNDIYMEPLHAYGGIFTTLEFGVDIPLNYRNGFFVAIGYRYNELNYDYESWDAGIVDRVYIYNRLSFRIGISLN